MTVKQISVFVENKPGMLAELANALNENKINMRALSLAETKDFGIIRLILDDPFNAVRVLKDCGYVCSITKVLAIAISNQPGSLGKVMQILGDNQIIEALTKNGVKPLCQDDLDELYR